MSTASQRYRERRRAERLAEYGGNRYLDPAPLLERLERVCRRSDGQQFHTRPSDIDLAAYLGVSRCTIQRWRTGQQVDIWNADRHAIAIGLHPLNIWPDTWPLGYPADDTEEAAA